MKDRTGLLAVLGGEGLTREIKDLFLLKCTGHMEARCTDFFTHLNE